MKLWILGCVRASGSSLQGSPERAPYLEGSFKGSFKASLKGSFKGSAKVSGRGSCKGSPKVSFKGSFEGTFRGFPKVGPSGFVRAPYKGSTLGLVYVLSTVFQVTGEGFRATLWRLNDLSCSRIS